MNWREPYRSMDAGGSPESAGNVAWKWIDSLSDKALSSADRLKASIESDGQTVALYLGTDLLAAATVFRDPRNFSVLIRWMDQNFERLVDDRPRCGCPAETIERVNQGGVCGRGGCPYGGDF